MSIVHKNRKLGRKLRSGNQRPGTGNFLGNSRKPEAIKTIEINDMKKQPRKLLGNLTTYGPVVSLGGCIPQETGNSQTTFVKKPGLPIGEKRPGMQGKRPAPFPAPASGYFAYNVNELGY